MEIKNDKIFLSWEDYIDDLKMLAKKLKDSEIREKWKHILGIPRGGLIPAVYLSHQLNIPLIPLEKFSPCFVKQLDRVLVVDDIVDTGKTLAPYAVKGCTIVALWHRLTSVVTPYYAPACVGDHIKWVVFPYEQDYDK